MKNTTITLEEEIELVAEAYYRGALVDLIPTKVGKAWQISASDERGNALAIANFPSEKQALGFVDLLQISSDY